MASGKQSERVLSGGLNFLAPTNKLNEGQALALTNCRVDESGQLVSRKGSDELFSGSFGPGHTLFRTGIVRFGGFGVDLRGGSLFEYLIASGFDGQPLGIVSYQNWVWIMNQAKQGKLPAFPVTPDSVLSEWVPAAPTAAPLAFGTDGGTWSGDFEFFYTFDTPFGHESGPSPISTENPGSLGGPAHLFQQWPTLQNIAASPDPQVDRRQIYAVGGPLTTPLRIGTVWGNVLVDGFFVPSFVARISIDNVIAQNIPIPGANDPPPPALGLVGPYFGKLIAFNSADHPARYWWTPTAQPWAWPGAHDDFEGQWEDTGDSGDPLLAVTNHVRVLIIYKRNSVWRLSGDPDTSDPEQVNVKLGTVGPKSVAYAGPYDFTVYKEGIYRFNGDFEEKISQAIDPLFKNDWVELADFHVSGAATLGRYYALWINLEFIHTCILHFSNGRLYFSYPEIGHSTPSATLVYDTETRTWSGMAFDSRVGSSGFTALYDEGQGGNFLGVINRDALTSIRILENDNTTDSGNPIPFIYQSRYMDQGLPDNDKVYSDVVIEYRCSDGDQNVTSSVLTVKALYDNGEVELLGQINSASWATAVYALRPQPSEGRVARRFAIRIEGRVMSTVHIRYVHLYWYPLARKGRTFDTGVIDCGTRQAKQVDRIELELTASRDGSWLLESDLPGGVVQFRRGSLFSAATRRTVLPITLVDPLDAHKPIEGRVLRLLVGTVTPPEPAAAPEPEGDPSSITLTIWSSFSGTLGTPKAPLSIGGFANLAVAAGLGSATTAINPATNMTTFDLGFFIDYSGGTVHMDPPGEVLSIWDAYIDAVYSNGTFRFRPVLAIPDNAGFSSGWVENDQLAIDVDSNPPTSHAMVERWHFSNLSVPAGLTLRNFTTDVNANPGGPGGTPSGDLIAGDLQMHRARIRMRVLGEYFDGARGEFFESSEIGGTALQRIDQFKDLLLDYDLAAAGSLQLYTDLPGNAVALQRTMTVPASSSRRTWPAALDTTAFLEGSLFKFRLVSAGIGRIYGATLRRRKIGVYMELSLGEIWEPQPIYSEHPMLYREIEFNLQSTGSVTAQIFTEMPGNQLAERLSYPIDPSAAVERIPHNRRLPGTTKGRLFQVKLAGSGSIVRLFSARVLARPLAGPGSHDWQWIPLFAEATPDAWETVEIPMKQTAPDYTWFELPVDPIT